MSILIIGKGVALSALVATAAFTGVHQQSTSPDPAPAKHVVCHPLFKKAPPALKADLERLRSLPKAERHQARREIRKKARAGDYGTDVQRYLQERREAAKALFKTFPKQLREDLRTAHELAQPQQHEAVKKIRQAALDGGYGTEVQHRLKERIARHKVHRAVCRTRHHGTTPGSSTPAPPAATES